MTLGLGLKAKRIEEGAIWDLMVLDIIIARLGIIAKPEQVVLLLGRGKACEISDILLLESEGDIEEKKEILLFFLFFL